MRYVDLSQPIHNHMPVYPGDSPTVLNNKRNFQEDGYCIWELCSSMHAGTHVDCPMHMLDDSRFIKDYPIEAFMGRASIIDASEQDIISIKEEYYKQIKEGDILLIYTGFDRFYGTKEYYENHPVISEELAMFIVQRRIKLVGVDMPSPDRVPHSIHKILLGAGIFILENLTEMGELLKEDYIEVFAQPLKLSAEASLVRAVARVGRDG